MQFGNKLRKLRFDRGWSQAEVAKAIGVSERVYSYYETNERTPSKPDIIQNIMKTFDVSFEYLFSADDHFEADMSPEYAHIKNINAQKILKKAKFLFTGGELDENEKDEMFEILTKLYFEAKKKNKQHEKKENKE